MMNVTDQTEAPHPDEKLKGWHVLLILLGFFGVMFSVNGVFLYHAITSFPGEDVKKSYVQGLHYNETLADRARQAELGWRAEAGIQGNNIVFRLRDREDRALTDLSVIGELRRLTTKEADRYLVFSSGRNGHYTTNADMLSAGQWQLRVSVLDAQAETVLFQVEKTLVVP